MALLFTESAYDLTRSPAFPVGSVSFQFFLTRTSLVRAKVLGISLCRTTRRGIAFFPGSAVTTGFGYRALLSHRQGERPSRSLFFFLFPTSMLNLPVSSWNLNQLFYETRVRWFTGAPPPHWSFLPFSPPTDFFSCRCGWQRNAFFQAGWFLFSFCDSRLVLLFAPLATTQCLLAPGLRWLRDTSSGVRRGVSPPPRNFTPRCSVLAGCAALVAVKNFGSCASRPRKGHSRLKFSPFTAILFFPRCFVGSFGRSARHQTVFGAGLFPPAGSLKRRLAQDFLLTRSKAPGLAEGPPCVPVLLFGTAETLTEYSRFPFFTPGAPPPLSPFPGCCPGWFVSSEAALPRPSRSTFAFVPAEQVLGGRSAWAKVFFSLPPLRGFVPPLAHSLFSVSVVDLSRGPPLGQHRGFYRR